MVEKKDNILKGFANWCYRFIVVRRFRNNKEQIDMNTLYVLDNPVDAYILFKEVNVPKHTGPYEEWILVDSFGKNAFSFCKQQAETSSVIE